MAAMLLATVFVVQLVGGEFIHTVEEGDSLTSIGARFGIEARVIARENDLAPTGELKTGETLFLDNRHITPPSGGAEIIVNIPQRMLFHFGEGTLGAYPIAAGKRSWPTPLGSFTIASIEENPVWDVPPSIQEEMRRQGKPVVRKVAPGPSNPLGRYWLGTSLPNIGIHGTNAPASIYSLQTHGCIRLQAASIEELFKRVSMGALGRTIYQPVLLAVVDRAVYLEVHQDVYKIAPDPAQTVRQLATEAGLDLVVDWPTITKVIQNHDGVARRVSLR